MVPSAFHWRESLPLTANSKIDRKTLQTLAGELGLVQDDYRAPNTPTERQLAAAWAKVLGIPQNRIGRRDHFFDRGGTSLSAVKLAITLDRAVSLKDVTRHPILADLAGLVDGRSELRSGRSGRSGLLQSLSESDGTQGAALVCFPYAERQRGELPADGRGAAGRRAAWSTPSSCPVTTWPPGAGRSPRWHRWSSRSSSRSSGVA